MAQLLLPPSCDVRNKIGSCFELAALPGATAEERSRLLHFVVVGGGPTGG